MVSLTKLCATVFVSCLAPSCGMGESLHSKESSAVRQTLPGKTCSRMGGKLYCPPNNDLYGMNSSADPRGGFLVAMPLIDADLIKCNDKYSKLDKYRGPAISLRVSDRFSAVDKDTTFKFYKRMRQDLLVDDEFGQWSKPKRYVKFHGLNCIHYEKPYLHKEMLCYGGAYGTKNPPFFFGCNRDGSVPLEGCEYNMFFNELEVDAHFTKQCAPFHAKINRLIVRYVNGFVQ